MTTFNSLFLVCDEPLKKEGEDLELGDEIGIREDDDEDMLGCKVEDAPLEALGEEGVLTQEVNEPVMSSAEPAREDLDYSQEETVAKRSCAAQPEFSLLTEDQEGIMSAASKATKEGVLTSEVKDCANIELKEDEEFLLPLKRDGDVLLPVKEDEENLLLVKKDTEDDQPVEDDKEEPLLVREDNENLMPVDEDTEIPVPGARVKILLPLNDEDDMLQPRTVDEAPKTQGDHDSTQKDEGKEEQRQAPEAAAVSDIPPTSSFESPLEWDDDGAEGWEPEEEVEEMIGNQGWAL